MSEERFDEHIKKQLESVKPLYQKEAWRNFQKLLPAPWYVAFYKQYTPWIYSGAAGLVILATSLLYFRENKQNQQLHETITTLKKQISENKIKPQSSAAPDTGRGSGVPGAGDIPDTIKLKDVRRVLSGKDTNELHPPAPRDLPASTTGPQQVDEQHPLGLVETPQVRTEMKIRQQNAALPPDKRRQGGKVNRHTAGPVTGTGKASRQESAGNQAESKAKPIDRPLDQPHNQVGHAGQRSPVAAPVDTSQVPQTAIVSGQADTLQLVARAAADSVGQEPGKAAKRNWLPGSFQARLGVAADYNGGNKIAGGPAVELLLGSRFGVNTGLLFSSPDRQQHPEPQEFHKATGRRFEDDYRRHMPRYDRIDRIKVKTTMLRLPLTLNYYFPTQSRLSFFIHGGTVLDLKAYQSVEFNSTYRGEDRKNRFEETPALKTFNNLILGAGGQYRFGRFVGQVTPYFDFNVRGQDYFNRKGKFGVNTSIKFDLTK